MSLCMLTIENIHLKHARLERFFYCLIERMVEAIEEEELTIVHAKHDQIMVMTKKN